MKLGDMRVRDLVGLCESLMDANRCGEDAKCGANFGEPCPFAGKVGDCVLMSDDLTFWPLEMDVDTGLCPELKLDPVNKPAHYNQGEIECIDAIETAVSGLNGPTGVLAGNVIKYVWRFSLKDGVKDLKKARWYLDRLIHRLERDKGF